MKTAARLRLPAQFGLVQYRLRHLEQAWIVLQRADTARQSQLHFEVWIRGISGHWSCIGIRIAAIDKE